MSSSPALAHVGERGFLSRLLPQLSKFKSNRFLVPPGDDAAVLKDSRHVLSIDGITEGTHFRASWDARCRSILGVPLARALGWKLMGASLSDLAAMGDTVNRWAMVYLGAPGRTPLKFLTELFRGVKETAARYDCALAGGDTVRAADLTLVAAVGGKQNARRSLVRSGAKPGDALCIAGTVGDAALGFKILDQGWRASDRKADAYFLKRFFAPAPLFSEGKTLAASPGVSALMDLSDSLDECLGLMMEASGRRAEIDLECIPVSGPFLKSNGSIKDFLSHGEDYSLLFSVRRSALRSLAGKLNFAVIGEVVKGSGVRYFWDYNPVKKPRSFSHF